MIARRPLIAGALAAAAFTRDAFAQIASGFDGEWNGVLHAGAQTLRLHLSISGQTATMFSVDQGNARIPAGTVAISGDQISLTFPAVNASYVGHLANGAITGQFTQGQTFPLNFERGAAPAAPPPPPPQALNAGVISALRALSGAPALAAAASKRGGRQVAFADGLRSASAGDLVTTGDQWHLGSMTKSMTATLIARCVEAGAVSWNDTVGDVLGHTIPDMRAEYHDVSFRHLCCHRAGLQPNIPMEHFNEFRRENPDARAERIAWSRLALLQDPVGPKEQTFTYSNSGYIIAGAMLEQRLGATWESLITARVFAPLGLSSAGFGAPGHPGRNDEPVGHAPGAQGPHTPYPPGPGVSDNPAALGPAGRVHMNFDDLQKYLAAHRDKLSPFLNTASWNTLHTPPFGGDYAMGWIKRGDAYWHNGSNTLFYSEMSFNAATGVVCCAAANDGDIDAVRPAVARALADAAFTVAS